MKFLRRSWPSITTRSFSIPCSTSGSSQSTIVVHRCTWTRPSRKFLVELYYKNFVRAGAQLSASDQTRLRALNQEESKLTTDFGNRLLAATKAGALVVDNVSDLDGFSPAEIATAADAAKQRGLTGKWVIPLQNTTQHPAQAELKNRAVRERLFIASTHACGARRCETIRARL